MAVNRRRRPRDAERTREAILEAARTRLANDRPEGLSLSEVAHLAGVNRDTAYQHFETRDKLIEATAEWVSDKLFRSVLGDPATLGERRVEQVTARRADAQHRPREQRLRLLSHREGRCRVVRAPDQLDRRLDPHEQVAVVLVHQPHRISQVL